MKKITYIAIAAASVLFAAACAKIDHAEGQKVTYYPTLELQGDNIVGVAKGGTFSEPGFTAVANGEDISDKVVVTNNIDINTPGVYTVTYAAANEDGFSAEASRTVVVVDPSSDENYYRSTIVAGGGAPRVVPLKVKVSGSTIEVADLVGGWYCLVRYPGYEAYGFDFWAESVITINPDNSLSLVSVGSWYFYGSFDYASFEGTFDPATGEIHYTFDGGWADVTLTPFSV